MDLDTYLRAHELSESSRRYLQQCCTAASLGAVVLAHGLLQFDETACCWGGPWEGGFAAFRLTDHRETVSPGHRQQKLVEIGDQHLARLRKGPSAMVTTACPFELKLFGNDDTTWSKFYATSEEARAELALFEVNQPLNYHGVVHDFGFVFTN